MTALLKAVQRKDTGRKVRRMGFVPGIVYGPGVGKSLPVQIEGKEIGRFLKGNSIGSKVKVNVDGKELQCVVKDMQYATAQRNLIHIDFYASSEDKPVKVMVPIIFRGKELLGTRNLVLNIKEDEIEIQGILRDLPEFVEVDVSSMNDGDVILMGDIKLPEGVKLLSKEESIVASAIEAEPVTSDVPTGDESTENAE